MYRLGDALDEFNALFPNEEACVDAVLRMKWPHGFVCEGCDHNTAYRINTRSLPLFECGRCGRQTSLTSGTLLHKSRTSLRKWLLAMFVVVQRDAAIHAVALSELLQVTYKTAFRMLRLIRQCISAIDSDILLEGHVQSKHVIYMQDHLQRDERITKEQSAIAARAKSNAGNNDCYYKIKLIARDKAARDRLTDKDRENFERSYCHGRNKSMEMDPRFQARWIHCTSLESIWAETDDCDSSSVSVSLAMTARHAFQWMNNTFHGIGPKYAGLYLDEYCYRLNGWTRGANAAEMWGVLLENMTSSSRCKSMMKRIRSAKSAISSKQHPILDDHLQNDEHLPMQRCG